MIETAWAEEGLEMEDQMDLEELPSELEHYDEAIETIRGKFVAVRIKIGRAPQTAKWGDAATQAALDAVDGASEDTVSLSSRLLDPKIESVHAVNEVCARINALKMDRAYTLPYVRPGVRLVRMGNENLDNLKRMTEKLQGLSNDLEAAAVVMHEDMEKIREYMKGKLKGLYQAANYDFDPRLRYNLSWIFEDVDVPSYLKHNAELQAQAEKDVQQEMREAVFQAEQQMAEGIFFIVDHLIERLETRRLLDKKHEVYDVQERGDVRIVTFRRKNASKKETAEMSLEDFNTRVRDDERRKAWNNYTAEKLFDEVAFAEKQAEDIGLGKGEMAAAFQRLKEMLGGKTRKDLVKGLKENGDMRDHFRDRLEGLGDQLLDMTVVKGRRDVIRGRSTSMKFNPEKL